MAYLILVQLLIFSSIALAKLDFVHRDSYLGQKNFSHYQGPYEPVLAHDMANGKIHFKDEDELQNFFWPYLFTEETFYQKFFQSDLNAALVCSNESLATNSDDIRFAYRLITLSYLLEGQWQLKMASDHFKWKDSCGFTLNSWLDQCRPKSKEMKTFLERLKSYQPKPEESLPQNQSFADWKKESSYVQYRLKSSCGTDCTEANSKAAVKKICEENLKLQVLICSEEDELYGLSEHREAFALLTTSNIRNSMAIPTEALGCLRRYSELMAHRESNYAALKDLFPVMRSYLVEKFGNRFPEGRTFFYGASKEFESLKEIFVKQQPMKILELPPEPVITEPKPQEPPKVSAPKPAPKAEKKPAPEPAKVVVEIPKTPKSAFLMASELREGSNLEKVAVDMAKFKYDYVFTLNMLNKLGPRLKAFQTQEALTEMVTYDKLGTVEGPMPLLFLKYLIDMEEHQGLWNILTVLGNRFYVSNEIDTDYKTKSEFVELANDASTNNQWQITVVKP